MLFRVLKELSYILIIYAWASVSTMYELMRREKRRLGIK